MTQVSEATKNTRGLAWILGGSIAAGIAIVLIVDQAGNRGHSATSPDSGGDVSSAVATPPPVASVDATSSLVDPGAVIDVREDQSQRVIGKRVVHVQLSREIPRDDALEMVRRLRDADPDFQRLFVQFYAPADGMRIWANGQCESGEEPKVTINGFTVEQKEKLRDLPKEDLTILHGMWAGPDGYVLRHSRLVIGWRNADGGPILLERSVDGKTCETRLREVDPPAGYFAAFKTIDRGIDGETLLNTTDGCLELWYNTETKPTCRFVPLGRWL